MRVLQICSKPPLPAIDGGCLASYQLSKNLLTAGFDLKLICLATEKHPFLPKEINQQYSKDVSMEVHSVKTALKPLVAFFNLFENKSIQERRFYHIKFAKKLKRILKEQDVDYIVFDGLLSCVYQADVRKVSKAKMIYRSHNVEYSIFDQRRLHEKNVFKKFYLGVQSARLMRFEMSKWNTMDAVLSISSVDIETLLSTGINPVKTEVMPFSVEVREDNINPVKNSLFHLGAMDWEPNIEGVRWFVKEIWPFVFKSHPEINLHLGGKNLIDIKDEFVGDGINIHDPVTDAESFAESYEILIVPLQSGSGTRIKVLQAMARGNVVVSTKKGLEGIVAINEKNAVIADDVESFVDCLEKIFNDDERKEKIRMEAKNFIRQNYNPDILSEKLKNWMIQL